MISIHTINTGKFKLDGGAMFGVVPKSMWNKLNPADENNMCTWALRCLLVKDHGRIILIDAGIGQKQDEKFRSHFYPHDTRDLAHELELAGVALEEVTDVLLTHLHFDHCGGALYKNSNGEILPTFPNAKIWTNDYHWNWAIKPNDREKASFLKENILPFQELGILHKIDVEQGIKFSESITLNFVYGHTGGMMIPTITVNNKRVIFTADLLPSYCHISMPYVMAYDVQPLLTLQEKAQLFERACDKDTYIFLEHDKDFESIQINKNEQGKVVFARNVTVGEI